jgi:hypothetical protein
MKRNLRFLAIFLSIAAAYAADNDRRFVVKPAAEYPAHITQEKVTVAAVPYINDDEVRSAFGKMNPNKYGVLPVLVVIENNTGTSLKLNLQAEFIDSRGHHIEAVPASDVTFMGAPPKRKDTNIGMGSPIPLPRKKKGGPLSGWEIEGHALNVRMIPEGEQVSGFVYFQTHMEPGAKLYLSGLSEAGSGKELFYFEAPLEAK